MTASPAPSLEELPIRDLRPSDLADKTGLSIRYWQQRIASGVVPGARFVALGARKMYVVRESEFTAWWETQLKEIKPWQAPSEREAASGGEGSRRPAKRTNAALKQRVRSRLASASQRGSES